ncbi:PEP-CTERM sorting domain-containing protein [Rubellicoccus peritrichatus]|uniref:PEP-CTERM sorting domain-containing protein n=1 Tax=Rubellicoccus peritrichatus TaxID=3080537 RepID=A0AAQ3LFN3_9BACT|nr:PEP-CTERM sorting domain-containing protein [Puniceicoccus sp. CR14]WOO43689.1 PEP-CTERM sorting domain-containing protein [Puniceicoccus sp. CR14]
MKIITNPVNYNTTTVRTSAASVCALLGASNLQAAVITNTDLGLSGFIVGNGTSSVAWNIDNVGNAELDVDLNATYFVNLTSFQNAFGLRATASAANAYMLNLGPSAKVNTGAFNMSSVFSVLFSGSIKRAVGFTSGESGYMGFQFNPSGSLVLYGWAEVILTEGGDSGTFEVVQWAYDDSGANIQTPVPEPATAALGLGALALGAAGLRRWRKAKQTT